MPFSMGSAPQSGSGMVRRRRRRSRPKGWKAIPKTVKWLMGICLLVLIFVPTALQKGWVGPKPADLSPTSSSGQSGLVIAEAALDPSSRTIKGLVKNTSKNSYREVQVSYYIRESSGLEAGTILGTIDNIGPDQTAPFQTDRCCQ